MIRIPASVMHEQQGTSDVDPCGTLPGMAVVKLNVDLSCDLAFVSIRDRKGKRFYEFGNLFGEVDLTELDEPVDVIDQIEQQLTQMAPRCRVLRAS